jgi:hypothetical protein
MWATALALLEEPPLPLVQPLALVRGPMQKQIPKTTRMH